MQPTPTTIKVAIARMIGCVRVYVPCVTAELLTRNNNMHSNCVCVDLMRMLKSSSCGEGWIPAVYRDPSICRSQTVDVVTVVCGSPSHAYGAAFFTKGIPLASFAPSWSLLLARFRSQRTSFSPCAHGSASWETQTALATKISSSSLNRQCQSCPQQGVINSDVVTCTHYSKGQKVPKHQQRLTTSALRFRCSQTRIACCCLNAFWSTIKIDSFARGVFCQRWTGRGGRRRVRRHTRRGQWACSGERQRAEVDTY